jgi:hypothetical protein
MDAIDDLGQKQIVLNEFLDDMRYVKGYASIVCPLEEGYLKDHNKMFFYDGEILQYMVGTNRIVKVTADVNSFVIKKDGVEYKGEKARAQFTNDADFKQWKRSCDGTKNILISDAYATIQLFKVNFVWEMKEMQLPKEFKFYTVQELLSFLKSREFEAVQAQYLPQKDSAKQADESP